MSFESFRGYVQLASGLGELTRARAMEAAQGLMSMESVSRQASSLSRWVRWPRSCWPPLQRIVSI
jgi:hypothetical protein